MVACHIEEIANRSRAGIHKVAENEEEEREAGNGEL
jgi:hypothetical protein